jgi:predicted nucleic acid-binding protein
MILYLDTSALVKRYFSEHHTREVLHLWREADEVAVSTVAYAEASAAFRRKAREGWIGAGRLDRALRALRHDWDGCIRVDVTAALLPWIDKVLESHPLRGFDAVHLASALLLEERLPGRVRFACFDRRLLAAAADHGLRPFPDATDI